ncbi:MAG: hypothetical protein AAF501_15520 [Pseudomonadota bacterium]
MRRVALAGLALVLLGPLAWWHWPVAALDARFPAQSCARIALTDAETGQPIVGVEDVARMEDGSLLLSADDRLGSDGGASGVYVYRPREGGKLMPLIADVRPHGIAVTTDGRFLALIDRSTDPVAVIIGEIVDGGFIETERHTAPGLCRANDLEWFFGGAAAGLLVTQDRSSCGTSIADLVGVETGRLLALAPGRGVTSDMGGYAFPNGISGLWIAETRANRIAFFRDTNGGPDTIGALSVPGGPDNLTLDGNDALVAGLHPSLIRLGLYRYGWTDHAPSRIARVTYPDGEVEILFDDPEGRVFSGATVGVLHDDRLIIGSVRDRGILVCEAG